MANLIKVAGRLPRRVIASTALFCALVVMVPGLSLAQEPVVSPSATSGQVTVPPQVCKDGEPVFPAEISRVGHPAFVPNSLESSVDVNGGRLATGTGVRARLTTADIERAIDCMEAAGFDALAIAKTLLALAEAKTTNLQQAAPRLDELAKMFSGIGTDVASTRDKIWDPSVAGTQSVANLKIKDARLQGEIDALKERVDTIVADLSALDAELGGVVYDKYGDKGLDFIVELNMVARSVRFLKSDGSGEQLYLRAWYDPHAAFFEKAHFATRQMVVVTERDRHASIWLMDIGAVAPVACGTNMMCIHVQTNVPTASYRGQKQAARWLAQVTKMTNPQIVGLLQQMEIPVVTRAQGG